MAVCYSQLRILVHTNSLMPYYHYPSFIYPLNKSLKLLRFPSDSLIKSIETQI